VVATVMNAAQWTALVYVVGGVLGSMFWPFMVAYKKGDVSIDDLGGVLTISWLWPLFVGFFAIAWPAYLGMWLHGRKKQLPKAKVLW
jgi:hypothetical protein